MELFRTRKTREERDLALFAAHWQGLEDARDYGGCRPWLSEHPIAYLRGYITFKTLNWCLPSKEERELRSAFKSLSRYEAKQLGAIA